tara:strand:- start:976 stop:1371 length:396 start_codon:yes stop_codon:yes gene_type:complete
MEKDLIERIEKARSGIEESYKKIINIYLNEIKDIYMSSNLRYRKSLEKRLDLFVTNIKERKITGNLCFDSEQAMAIRKRLGISQEKLAEEMETNQAYISRIERNDRIKPNKKNMRYFLWLKKQGYNPFDLK